MSKPKIEVRFAPGALDDFDGTQEELDEIIAQIQQMAEDGTLLENSIICDETVDYEGEECEMYEVNPHYTKRTLQ